MTPRYSREGLIRDLRELTEEKGTVPTIDDVADAPSVASAITYRSRFGSWSEALKEAEIHTLVDDVFQCPTCAAPFGTEHGMKAHHAADHGEALAQETCECEYCGTEFTEYQSRIKNGRGRYCSRECYESVGAVEAECSNCGTGMVVQKHRAEEFENIFCSTPCELDWRSEAFSGEDHPQYNRVTVECSICGEELIRSRNRVETYEHQLCSKECFKAWCSELRIGEKNPAWNGGVEPFYGHHWKTTRRRILERDNHECQQCGLSREDHYSEYGWDLEVHHITPLRKFDDPEEANAPGNLITFCRDCHKAADSDHSGEVEV